MKRVNDDTVPVSPETAELVLDRLQDDLPDAWRLMPIGGTEMATVGEEGGTTKDLDVVVVTIQEGGAAMPEYDELVDEAERLSDHVETRKDHTCVRFRLATDAGLVTVEFVRGRTPGKGGYFVSRSVLETAAELAAEDGGLLRPPIEVLAFLKAWAAHDKAKLVEAGKDARGYHSRRRQGFLEDVQRLQQVLADADREPNPQRFETLFSATGGQREEAVRRILEEREWPL